MYGGYYGYGYYFDPTYFLVLIGLVLCLGASALVNSTMRKYSKVRNMRGITGAEAARNLLNREGLYNVQIECLNANDGDHYDPRTDTVRLSYNNYNGTSVTAVSVAGTESGTAEAFELSTAVRAGGRPGESQGICTDLPSGHGSAGSDL